jgi:predicted lactoylglutathione lyase
MAVPARVTLVTLGVSDVARATAFYEALGWPLSPASVPGEVSFFNTDGAILALWSRQELANDTGLRNTTTGVGEVAIAMNLDDRAQVDAAFDEVKRAGGTIVKAPVATDWGGYSGYFADPDGHLWEIAHNPHWPIGDDGRPALPRA